MVKKKGYKSEKLVIQSSWKRKTLEKNPQKGGTPAIENSAINKSFVKTLLDPKSLKEWVVLKLFVTIWNIHVKTINRERL